MAHALIADQLVLIRAKGCKLKGWVTDRPRVAPFTPARSPESAAIAGLNKGCVPKGDNRKGRGSPLVSQAQLKSELAGLAAKSQSLALLNPLSGTLSQKFEVCSHNPWHGPNPKTKL